MAMPQSLLVPSPPGAEVEGRDTPGVPTRRQNRLLLDRGVREWLLPSPGGRLVLRGTRGLGFERCFACF